MNCEARAGMVMPNASYNDHPCHDIALGERLVKDIYEALRAGPGWQKTLFLTVFLSLSLSVSLCLSLSLPVSPCLSLMRTLL